jgi:endonuclease YncB( thermonuclease family)
MARSISISLAGMLLSVIPAKAQSSPWALIPETAVFETGDSWIAEGVRFRLYGVQACLRGTYVTNVFGQKRDCGETSLAMLVSLIRDYRPVCAAVLEGAPKGVRHVTCVAAPKTGKAAGSRIDLGTALIASGFGFAALQPDSKPVHMPYFVAELDARRAKAGLWTFADLPEPNAIILKALRAKPDASSPAGGALR